MLTNRTRLSRFAVVVALSMLFPVLLAAQGLKTRTIFDWSFEKPSPEYLSQTYKWSPQQVEQYLQLVDAAIQSLDVYKQTAAGHSDVGEFFRAAKKELREEIAGILTPEQAEAWTADWNADMLAIKAAKKLYNENYTKEVSIRAQGATYAPLAALRAEYITKVGNIVGAEYAELLFEEMALHKLIRTNEEIVLLESPYHTAKEYARRKYKYGNELAMTYSEEPSRNRRIKLSLIKSQFETDASEILGPQKAWQRERLNGSEQERWYRNRLGLTDTQIESCKTLHNVFAVKAYQIRNNQELSCEEKAVQITAAVAEMPETMQTILTLEQYAIWNTYQQNRDRKKQSRER